ncbi:rabenosyn-5 [Cylas formicarius]|uniref:rabenosyn-5 n=1 Tax=Cylas formicarius TaxID=197179 RepID=UPI00295885EB|nr:rabenosyn-5 [Cylas formicarius]
MSDVQEGFLCPICRKDMRSPNNLIVHFQEMHSEEKEFLKSIKDIYGGFLKILKIEDEDLESFKKEIVLEKCYIEISDPQDPGISKSHTDYFRAIRRNRLDHRTAETNKLIIRLDKLLRTFGTDRKQQEQELVVWLDGSTVSRCPSCAVSFNIARRQHHCRLCGSIMCGSCSHFLSYETAQTIIAPVYNIIEKDHGNELNSIRICKYCLDMLESRRKVQVEQMMQPIICQLYSLLQKNKTQIQSSVDLYNKMYDSLMSGETTFFLPDLQALRSSIAEKGQMIDTLSKKIASLSVDSDTPKAAPLQNNIRKATSVYIKEYLLALPPPPTAEELERIRERCSKMFKDDSLPEPSNSKLQKVAVTTGWSPAHVPNEFKVDQEENPLIEQMNIVRNYIAQARAAQRFEEVVSLEANLKMLKETYSKELKKGS